MEKSPCLYGWKEGAGHFWEGRRDLSTVFDETRGDWKKMSKEQLIAELKRFDNEVKTSIIYEDKPAKSEGNGARSALLRRHKEAVDCLG